MIICECVHKRRKLGTADAVDAVHFVWTRSSLRRSSSCAPRCALRLSTKGSAKALCSALPFSTQAAAAVENGSAMG